MQKEFVDEIIRMSEADPVELIQERRKRRESSKGKRVDQQMGLVKEEMRTDSKH